MSIDTEKPWTTGPWTLSHVSGENFAVQRFDLRGMFGGSPNTYPIFNRDTSAINGTTFCAHPADAALIAAAPDLYAALERLCDVSGRSRNISDARAQAQEALEKVRRAIEGMARNKPQPMETAMGETTATLTAKAIIHQYEERVSMLRTAMQEACDLLAERKRGISTRSPGHNARVTLEYALSRLPASAPSEENT